MGLDAAVVTNVVAQDAPRAVQADMEVSRRDAESPSDRARIFAIHVDAPDHLRVGWS